MLIVKVRKNNIERALKELKSKVIKTRQNSQLNERREFTKKSIKKRQQLIKAKYRSKMNNEL
jgi:small subunit ribosomal protein S21